MAARRIPSPGSNVESWRGGVVDNEEKAAAAALAADSCSASFSYVCSSRRNRPIGVPLLLPDDEGRELAARRPSWRDGKPSGFARASAAFGGAEVTLGLAARPSSSPSGSGAGEWKEGKGPVYLAAMVS